MKRGKFVAVCYDGKYGRRVKGEVLRTNKSRILVRFPAYTGDTLVEHWFHQRRRSARWGGPRKYYAGFVPVPNSLMVNLGITDIGDWYRIFTWKD
jgi:hypothetical protein